MSLKHIRYELAFPHPEEADENGIVAFGGDLSPSRLMLAYRSGIFPWYSAGDPILWWAPNPRNRRKKCSAACNPVVVAEPQTDTEPR